MTAPKWQRRAEERPREICAAALQVFAEKGFAAAKLDEIARRAGVSKGTLYLYFKDKEDLFRAVVRDAIAPNVQAITSAVSSLNAPFPDVVRMFLAGFAEREARL
ncbi:MAG TPA: helix-turn-helix domain-containing protein, partial [Sphingomicrobium sp.]|nr:helix-turn-helix domain-containing protein [Sphingomicrobium sp.]